MKENYVTRGEIIRMLQSWQAGELATQQLWDWASHRFQSGAADYDDWDGDDSVAREVLAALDSLDLHLMLADDVPLYLAFLTTPIGAFEDARKAWRAALAGLDYASRKQQLRNDPVYALYCD
ncbi:hypothetical protein [Janthinobacterium sp. 17J80-10]|uniref:hypothetical protein n=1 Tax=Janthinobacterium sp. 17J80-10 TaxID=2497863 RepID=UPI0010056145|nr:hypothetical protein [Janthinobacterium sp. 17J80-10]QAU34169.1 hypothetical protein EKL02_08205 [Janthinobacterium sp. 17J80-10]